MEIIHALVDFLKIGTLVLVMSYAGGKSILFIQDRLVAAFLPPEESR